MGAINAKLEIAPAAMPYEQQIFITGEVENQRLKLESA